MTNSAIPVTSPINVVTPAPVSVTVSVITAKSPIIAAIVPPAKSAIIVSCPPKSRDVRVFKVFVFFLCFLFLLKAYLIHLLTFEQRQLMN